MLVSFFFFKQKTEYEMRISDWISDVCSSDLVAAEQGERRQAGLYRAERQRAEPRLDKLARPDRPANLARRDASVVRVRPGESEPHGERQDDQIGRASSRERVCQYV